MVKVLILFLFLLHKGNSHIIQIDEPRENPLMNFSIFGGNVFKIPNFFLGTLLRNRKPEDGNPEELGDYVEGDILIPINNEKGAKSGLVEQSYRWINGTIPYVLTGAFTGNEKNTIYRAFTEIETRTCIRFVPRKLVDPDYMVIESAEAGCFSAIGRIGGRQVVNLQNSICLKAFGTVLHELSHTIGLIHENNREDRSEYIEILWQNIADDSKNNFEKAATGSTSAYNVAYDYDSVMHFSPYAFSKNRRLIIAATKSGAEKMGQREGFSRGDIEKINKMYYCKGFLGLSPDTIPKLPGKPAATFLAGIGNFLAGKH